MLSADIEILEFNQYQKSYKAPFSIYLDIEYLIEKIYGCKNNIEKLLTTKVGEHIQSGFLMSTISSTKSIENEHNAYRVKIAWKSFVNS